MLARHERERELRELQLRAAEAREEAERLDRRARARRQQQLRQQVAQSGQRWRRDRDERRDRLRHEERDLRDGRAEDLARREGRWRRLAREQEEGRKQKLEGAKGRADRRRSAQRLLLGEKEGQDRDLRERKGLAAEEKLALARRKRSQTETEGKKKIQEVNRAALVSHRARRAQLEMQVQAEASLKKLSLERRFQRAEEIHQHLLQERHREIRDKAVKEEAQQRLAKARAEETEGQKQLRNRLLVEMKDQKIQQASRVLQKNIRDRAQRVKEVNGIREKNHCLLKQMAEEEEKCHLEGVRAAIRRKERKMDQISREKGAMVEESRKIAKASLQMRDGVRALHSLSFDQMALEAQLNASLHTRSQ